MSPFPLPRMICRRRNGLLLAAFVFAHAWPGVCFLRLVILMDTLLLLLLVMVVVVVVVVGVMVGVMVVVTPPPPLLEEDPAYCFPQ